MSTTPSLAEVIQHQARGGLWRMVPARTPSGQPRPQIVELTVQRGRAGTYVSLERGASIADHAERHENRHLRGARWYPVDVEGRDVAP